MFDEIRHSMQEFRVKFDVWFHENSLYEDGEVEKAIDDLRARGDIYEKDGATWFESTKHGDDKDRVIIKSDGNYAYFAADIAYYRNKRHRKGHPADVAIYMLGADHHGYIGRMMAMCAAFGDKPGENMQILIGQLVNVMKDRMADLVEHHRHGALAELLALRGVAFAERLALLVGAAVDAPARTST